MKWSKSKLSSNVKTLRTQKEKSLKSGGQDYKRSLPRLIECYLLSERIENVKDWKISPVFILSTSPQSRYHGVEEIAILICGLELNYKYCMDYACIPQRVEDVGLIQLRVFTLLKESFEWIERKRLLNISRKMVHDFNINAWLFRIVLQEHVFKQY